MKILFIIFLWFLIANIASWVSVFISCLINYKDEDANNETRVGMALALLSYVFAGLLITLLNMHGIITF